MNGVQLNLTFEQVFSIIKQLPEQEKIKLSKELEKETINSKLSRLLKVFETQELSLETIDREVESVRQDVYDSRKN